MAYNNDRRDRRKDEAPSEFVEKVVSLLSLIHISEPTRP